MKNRPFFLLSILAMVALIGIGRLMDQEIKSAKVVTPEGYQKTIMALEFAQDTVMINAIFELPQPDSIRTERANRLVCSTNYDYLYILAYASFMLLFALQCKRLGAKGLVWAVLWTLMAAFSDVMENLQLMKIFNLVRTGGEDYSGIFWSLRFWMALKFFSIGAFFLALGPFFWKSNGLGKVVVVVAWMALVYWALACFLKPEFWADALFIMIFLAFAGAMIFGLTYRVRRD
ncbi:MAG: hypothetical protein Q7T20_04635 [Saprospiraceae bacterium]|nr:hypothetical protein [Saprospiraceae bacterium]